MESEVIWLGAACKLLIGAGGLLLLIAPACWLAYWLAGRREEREIYLKWRKDDEGP